MNPSTRPNVVLILADDMGFSDIASYGGEISTPNLDRLAAQGTRLTQFYNTARCSPSRASLLTGLHPHQVGIGILTGPDGPVGYPGDLNREGPTVAEILKSAGYATAVIGKWHLSADVNTPTDAWPTRRGFDYFYGTLIGCGSYYDPPTLVRGEEPVEVEDPNFYYTDAIGDEAVAWIAGAAAKEDPFFLYVPFTAPHWPLHAPDATVRRYAGHFDAGWDDLREQRLARQRDLGIVGEQTKLSPRDPEEPAWADVAEPAWQARRMEVYAAQVELMDAAIGRILDALDEAGVADDTVVIALSDNGASPEEVPHIADFRNQLFFGATTRQGEPVQLGNQADIQPGPATTYASYGRGWANLSNTPFRLYKKWVHEGGIAAPFLVRWPAGGVLPGAIARTPHQLTHVLPTILDALAVPAPATAGGLPGQSIEGTSFLGELRGTGGSTATTIPLFWEHCGNGAVRRGDWKLVRVFDQPWELYDLSSDPTELHDVAHEHADVAEDLLGLWVEWARRVGVRPFEQIVDLYELRGGGEPAAAR